MSIWLLILAVEVLQSFVSTIKSQIVQDLVYSFLSCSLPLCKLNNVSVLHQEEGGIGKSIPDTQDYPRPERFPEGNLEV